MARCLFYTLSSYNNQRSIVNNRYEMIIGKGLTKVAQNKKHINSKDSEEVADKYFESSDHKGKSQIEKGLAETHEQVEDDYFEGTIDQKK